MERESIIQDERKNLNKFKQKVKPKPTIPVLIYSDVKCTWKNFIENLLLSPLIKHQTILDLYVENTTFSNFLQKLL